MSAQPSKIRLIPRPRFYKDLGYEEQAQVNTARKVLQKRLISARAVYDKQAAPDYCGPVIAAANYLRTSEAAKRLYLGDVAEIATSLEDDDNDVMGCVW